MLTEGTKIRQFCRCQGVSSPFDSDFRGSSIAESLYLSESLRPITTEFNLFVSRGEFVVINMDIATAVGAEKSQVATIFEVARERNRGGYL